MSSHLFRMTKRNKVFVSEFSNRFLKKQIISLSALTDFAPFADSVFVLTMVELAQATAVFAGETTKMITFCNLFKLHP